MAVVTLLESRNRRVLPEPLPCPDSCPIQTFNVSSVPQPCTAVQWVLTAQKVTHGGDLVLNEASVGLCLGPAPQGTVIVSATQSKVSGL